MIISQMDITAAYLYGQMDTEVYMEKPKLLEEMLHEMVNKEKSTELGGKAEAMLSILSDNEQVCKLKRSIYRLKQSGRQWHTRLNQLLTSSGLSPPNSDTCVYTDETGEFSVLVYVNDILVAYKNEHQLMKFKQVLINEFSLKDLGEVKLC